MRDDSWQDRAACRGTDVEIFYSDEPVTVRTALALCRRCEVRAACYEHAMSMREAFGVWGGTPEEQRRRIFRRQRRTRSAA